MTCKGDLLDILEAREQANLALKRQDVVIARLRGDLDAAEVDHTQLFGTWRIINNELAQAAAEVFAWEEE